MEENEERNKRREKLREVLYNIRDVGITAGVVTGIAAIAFSTGLGATAILNKALNNKIIDKPGYHLVLRSYGIGGYTKHIKYSDGSTEIEKAPFLGRIGVTKTYQELNRDKFVDRIKKERGEILVREYDYQTHKKEFDEADGLLRELSSK